MSSAQNLEVQTEDSESDILLSDSDSDSEWFMVPNSKFANEEDEEEMIPEDPSTALLVEALLEEAEPPTLPSELMDFQEESIPQEQSTVTSPDLAVSANTSDNSSEPEGLPIPDEQSAVRCPDLKISEEISDPSPSCESFAPSTTESVQCLAEIQQSDQVEPATVPMINEDERSVTADPAKDMVIQLPDNQSLPLVIDLDVCPSDVNCKNCEKPIDTTRPFFTCEIDVSHQYCGDCTVSHMTDYIEYTKIPCPFGRKCQKDGKFGLIPESKYRLYLGREFYQWKNDRDFALYYHKYRFPPNVPVAKKVSTESRNGASTRQMSLPKCSAQPQASDSPIAYLLKLKKWKRSVESSKEDVNQKALLKRMANPTYRECKKCWRRLDGGRRDYYQCIIDHSHAYCIDCTKYHMENHIHYTNIPCPFGRDCKNENGYYSVVLPEDYGYFIRDNLEEFLKKREFALRCNGRQFPQAKPQTEKDDDKTESAVDESNSPAIEQEAPLESTDSDPKKVSERSEVTTSTENNATERIENAPPPPNYLIFILTLYVGVLILSILLLTLQCAYRPERQNM